MTSLQSSDIFPYVTHATPAVSNGRMFIHGFEHLFCLEAR